MPQPRKPAPSGRTPPARQSAAPKSTRGPAKAPQAERPAPPPAAAPTGQEGDAEQPREEQLHAAAASLRDLLSRGVVITADRLQETVDEAVRLGRMTREDAEELARNLVEIGRRQAQDTLAEVESLLGSSATQTRRQVRARLKGVGAAARHAPGGDRALRTVDRVRRAAGLTPALPIAGYDDLTTAQVKERLGGLEDVALRRLRDHERRNANRKSVLAAIEKHLS